MKQHCGKLLTPRIYAVLLGSSLMGGCIGFKPPNSNIGTVTASGTRIGTFQSLITSCTSGARGYFMGADLFSRDGRVRTRVVMQPLDGPGLLITSLDTPGHALRLSTNNCSTLNTRITLTNVYINGIRGAEGFVEFTCALQSGGTISGDLRFAGCY